MAIQKRTQNRFNLFYFIDLLLYQPPKTIPTLYQDFKGKSSKLTRKFLIKKMHQLFL